MNKEKNRDAFHQNNSSDLYDLYNACNGAMYDGFLDIRKFEELSDEETQILDLPKLYEVWQHTHYCNQCIATINILNEERKRLKKLFAENDLKSTSLDSNHIQKI